MRDQRLAPCRRADAAVGTMSDVAAVARSTAALSGCIPVSGGTAEAPVDLGAHAAAREPVAARAEGRPGHHARRARSASTSAEHARRRLVRAIGEEAVAADHGAHDLGVAARARRCSARPGPTGPGRDSRRHVGLLLAAEAREELVQVVDDAHRQCSRATTPRAFISTVAAYSSWIGKIERARAARLAPMREPVAADHALDGGAGAGAGRCRRCWPAPPPPARSRRASGSVPSGPPYSWTTAAVGDPRALERLHGEHEVDVRVAGRLVGAEGAVGAEHPGELGHEVRRSAA